MKKRNIRKLKTQKKKVKGLFGKQTEYRNIYFCNVIILNFKKCYIFNLVQPNVLDLGNVKTKRKNK